MNQTKWHEKTGDDSNKRRFFSRFTFNWERRRLAVEAELAGETLALPGAVFT